MSSWRQDSPGRGDSKGPEVGKALTVEGLQSRLMNLGRVSKGNELGR